jgi:hypothetical protein
MPKLTDTRLVILSAAARREDGAALPLPKSLRIRGAAATKTLESLRKKGLLEEKPAPRDAAAWRKSKDGRRLMLVITEAGLRVLGAEPAPGTDTGLPRPRRSCIHSAKASLESGLTRNPRPRPRLRTVTQ